MIDIYNNTLDKINRKTKLLDLKGQDGVCQVALNQLLYEGMVIIGSKINADFIKDDGNCIFPKQTICTCLYLQNKTAKSETAI